MYASDNDTLPDSRDVSIAFLVWELVKAQSEIRRLKVDVRDYKADNARIAAQWDRLQAEKDHR